MQLVDASLPDGDYDAFVVWAETRADGAISLDLTITTGARKGGVVSVRAAHLERESVDLVGLPCTLVVEHGAARVRW